MRPDVRLPEGLPPRIERALRAAVEWIDDSFAPAGVFACGSLLRGEAGPTSDLDLYVIHRAPWKQRIQRRFGGVPAEVFVNTPASCRAFVAEEAASGRPITAHMLATGHVAIDRDPVVAALRDEARAALGRGAPLAGDAALFARYTVACLLDDARDVLGADDAAASQIAADTVKEALRFAVRRRTGRVPRDKDLVRDAAAADPECGRLAREFHAASAAASRVALAAAVAARAAEVDGFFEWDSERVPAPVD